LPDRSCHAAGKISAARIALAVEDMIRDFARRARADLIVSGAYGHSGMREWIFGGVTRALIQKATVPFLLSH
jgi:nucleotide-binding universal stress UspA family protein